ncbi:cyclopentanol dehydrogenase [Rhizorhabdus wittichii DC-6]|uniref:Short-chain dehydrogenase/reductase SDR n=1 Tax=Rhizorhabdus wittichii (strain DSM 6014 / CCUG 31198 / JCM 15750 / NBRC 105917 / EY 4224 / RW1) TaxID=392499 RepID=A0A9J9HB15_RHIWR|nr:short-chain dehydrogenase/reductase SDR [Rhizorhabdus wittichii RW1]ARR54760.1 cyclopentanol dehydrogenase [Rhizorhabdus wittichii DC-6]
MRVKGKVTIITGAASGMGASHARLFAREGARVVVADILEAEGRAVVEDIVARGGEAVFERLDISSEADWDRVMDAATARFGPLDILVNNAGLTGSGVQEVDEIALFDRLIATNLRGPFLGVRAAVRRMEGRGGAIVNVASISANIGNPGVHIGYNASKGGVRTLTRAAAAEYGPRKIRVNSVNPGVLPPMIGSKRVDVAEGLLARVPLNRTGQVEEVSNAVLFLASDEASYINGVELDVDGGLVVT